MMEGERIKVFAEALMPLLAAASRGKPVKKKITHFLRLRSG